MRNHLSKPEISVILPVHNGQQYLKEAIESILNQTFPDFELIVINDGSTDSSESIILDYKDSRIKYLRQENAGVGATLRKGCALANGTYIARMDADDICFPQRFEVQKAYLDYNPKTVLVSNAVVYIDQSGNSIGRSFPYTSGYAINKILKIGSPICHPGVMMRKSAYESTGGYKGFKLLEDLCLWIELSKHGSLHNIRTPLMKYRILNTSVSRSITNDQYKIFIEMLDKMLFEGTINDREIFEFNRMFEMAEKETMKNNGRKVNEINSNITNSKTETLLYNLFSGLRLSESITEFIICKIKNTSTYFRN
jgi:glycosyltransferase involved in cell wall biosynthesis